jgi:hypothetical protein
MPAHTHLKPTRTPTATLTLTYRSLRSSRRSIHNGCKEKIKKVVNMYFGKKPTGKQGEEGKEKSSKRG